MAAWFLGILHLASEEGCTVVDEGVRVPAGCRIGGSKHTTPRPASALPWCLVAGSRVSACD